MITSTETKPSRGFRLLTIAALVVVVMAGLPLLIGPVVIWLPDDIPRALYADDYASHRIHIIGLSASFWTLVGSLASQLRRPARNLASMVLAVGVMLTFIPLDLMSGIFSPLELVVLILLLAMIWTHPGRSGHPWRPPQVGTVAVVAVGAIPLLFNGWSQLQNQLSGSSADPHVELGHYGSVAILTLVVLLAVTIGATSLPGFTVSTALGAAGAAMFGIASTILPEQASSLGRTGGLALILWAATLMGIAFTRALEPSADVASRNAGEAVRR